MILWQGTTAKAAVCHGIFFCQLASGAYPARHNIRQKAAVSLLFLRCAECVSDAGDKRVEGYCREYIELRCGKG